MLSIAALYSAIHLSPSTDEDGYSVMECVSHIAGEPRSVTPACACPVLAAFATCTNDMLADGPRQALQPIMLHLAASRVSEEAEKARLAWLVDFALCDYLPKLLPSVNLEHWAPRLAALRPDIAKSDYVNALHEIIALCKELQEQSTPLLYAQRAKHAITRPINVERSSRHLANGIGLATVGEREGAVKALCKVFFANETLISRVDMLLRMMVIDCRKAIEQTDEVLQKLLELTELAK